MMKKFLASMLMMASITAASEAAPVSSVTKADKAQTSVMVPYRNDVYDMLKTSHNTTLGGKYNPISTDTYFKTNEWGLNNPYTNPFVYEPNSGYLFAMHRAGGPSGTIGMMYSTDGGSSWIGPEIVFSKVDTYPVNVSFAVTNPSKSKNLSDMRFVISAPYAEATSDDQTEWKGAMYLLMSDVTAPDAAQFADFWGPVDNNPGSQQRWWSTGMFSNVTSDSRQLFFNYGMLSNATNAPYGNYGFSVTEMTPGKEDVPVSTIPSQWALSKFKQADDPTKGSYNNVMGMDCDASGNLYALVNNMFIEDADARVFAVSKSTNNGSDWSEFEKAPKDLLKNYVATKGADVTLNYFAIPYDGDGFTVTGTDEFSYLCKVLYYITEEEYVAEFIEVYKKAGTWGIRFIGEGTGWIAQCIDHEGLTATSTEYNSPFYAENPRSNEMQLAKTADGKHVVAKWIEYVDSYGTPTSITINKRNSETADDLYDYNEITIDTVLTTDIFIAYRPVDGTTWTTLNVTKDTAFFNKSTYIPRIVPSINDIPLFALVTGSTISSSFPEEATWPEHFKQMITDHSQVLTYTKIDVDNIPSGINEDNGNSNMSISTITPNPATSSATICFNVETSGVATVKVFNVMGQEVATLFNNYVDGGKFITSFDATKVNEGTYYVTLVINGKSTTKVLNVVK